MRKVAEARMHAAASARIARLQMLVMMKFPDVSILIRSHHIFE